MIRVAESLGLVVQEKDLSLTEFYNADEVFATGTMGELTPVVEIDGRKIENRSQNRMTSQLQEKFKETIPSLCEKPD